MFQYIYVYIAIELYVPTMPSIHIYLDEKLFEFVKDNKSKIIQQALKELIKKQKKLKNHPSTHIPA